MPAGRAMPGIGLRPPSMHFNAIHEQRCSPKNVYATNHNIIRHQHLRRGTRKRFRPTQDLLSSAVHDAEAFMVLHSTQCTS